MVFKVFTNVLLGSWHGVPVGSYSVARQFVVFQVVAKVLLVCWHGVVRMVYTLVLLGS